MGSVAHGLHIALLTPEFVTEVCEGTGLATYLQRVGRLLAERGHRPEVFVPSSREPRLLEHERIRVHRVHSAPNLAGRVLRRASSLVGRDGIVTAGLQARALARAMESRHRQAPFDVVQSADYLAVGLFVRRRQTRRHVVRCSWAADLWNAADGRASVKSRSLARLERRVMRKADGVYAPSRFVAEYFRTRHAIPVELVRPPAMLETAPAEHPPCGLPARFLLHFGELCRRKGTLWLAEALRKAFSAEPAMRMVWVGPSVSDDLRQALALLGPDRWKVLALYAVPKPDLYAMVQRAAATVLPSLADNLPNTVIESLMLGVPVVGTRGASIDELVEDGVTGELVPPGDTDALAAAVVRAWRGATVARPAFAWQGRAFEEMQPDRAVDDLLRVFSRS